MASGDFKITSENWRTGFPQYRTSAKKPSENSQCKLERLETEREENALAYEQTQEMFREPWTTLVKIMWQPRWSLIDNNWQSLKLHTFTSMLVYRINGIIVGILISHSPSNPKVPGFQDFHILVLKFLTRIDHRYWLLFIEAEWIKNVKRKTHKANLKSETFGTKVLINKIWYMRINEIRADAVQLNICK